jgi:hypothetical protein
MTLADNEVDNAPAEKYTTPTDRVYKQTSAVVAVTVKCVYDGGLKVGIGPPEKKGGREHALSRKPSHQERF